LRQEKGESSLTCVVEFVTPPPAAAGRRAEG
jgi:hypothetical protein